MWTNITPKESRSKREESRVVLTLTSEKACLGVKSVGNKEWLACEQWVLPEGVRPGKAATQATGKGGGRKMHVKCKCFKIICICYYKQEGIFKRRIGQNEICWALTKIKFKICPLVSFCVIWCFWSCTFEGLQHRALDSSRHWFWNKTHGSLYLHKSKLLHVALMSVIGLAEGLFWRSALHVYIKRN